MKLIKWAILIIAVVIVFKFINERFGPAMSKGESSGTWVALEPISGDGNQTTMAYSSPRGETRIHWEVNNPWTRQGKFSIRAMRPDGGQIRLLADVGVSGSDRKTGEYYFRDIREFYLVIGSTVSWKITVEVKQ